MVASESRAPLNGKNPAQALFQSYFGGLEAFGQAYNPFLKGAARAQLEFMGLMSRRAQAYMEFPSRLASCRAPQDLLNEQMNFWRSAGEDYADCFGRMMEAVSSLPAPSFGVPSQEAQNPHDYITFPEPKEPPQTRAPRGRERRRAA